MFERRRDQWRFTTLRPVVIDCGYGRDFSSICTGMEAENRPRNWCPVSCGTLTSPDPISRARGAPSDGVGCHIIAYKYKQLDGGLPDAARLRGGVYAGLPSTIQPFQKQ